MVRDMLEKAFILLPDGALIIHSNRESHYQHSTYIYSEKRNCIKHVKKGALPG